MLGDRVPVFSNQTDPTDVPTSTLSPRYGKRDARTPYERRAIRTFSPLPAISVERKYQDDIWGKPTTQNTHTIPEWVLIAEREMGEAEKEGGDVYWGNQGADLLDFRAELVQAAAVLVSMIEALDAGQFGPVPEYHDPEDPVHEV